MFLPLVDYTIVKIRILVLLFKSTSRFAENFLGQFRRRSLYYVTNEESLDNAAKRKILLKNICRIK